MERTGTGGPVRLNAKHRGYAVMIIQLCGQTLTIAAAFMRSPGRALMRESAWGGLSLAHECARGTAASMPQLWGIYEGFAVRW
jgi:hypothetical protein